MECQSCDCTYSVLRGSMQSWKPLKKNPKQMFALSILQNLRPVIFLVSSTFSPNSSGPSLIQCARAAPFFLWFPASLLPDTAYRRKGLVPARLHRLLAPHSLLQVKGLPPCAPDSQK